MIANYQHIRTFDAYCEISRECYYYYHISVCKYRKCYTDNNVLYQYIINHHKKGICRMIDKGNNGHGMDMTDVEEYFIVVGGGRYIYTYEYFDLAFLINEDDYQYILFIMNKLFVSYIEDIYEEDSTTTVFETFFYTLAKMALYAIDRKKINLAKDLLRLYIEKYHTKLGIPDVMYAVIDTMDDAFIKKMQNLVISIADMTLRHSRSQYVIYVSICQSIKYGNMIALDYIIKNYINNENIHHFRERIAHDMRTPYKDLSTLKHKLNEYFKP